MSRRKLTITPKEQEGEDGDFVQLRAVRERRQKEDVSSQDSSYKKRLFTAATNIVITGRHLSKETSQRQISQRLGEQMFMAVDAGDKDEVLSLIAQIGKVDQIWTVRKPDTNENVLHYALSQRKRNIAEQLILTGNDEFLLSHHDVQRSGMHGRNNALHILTEQNDIEMVKLILSKVSNAHQRKELIKLETAVEIQGQRPRLLSCLHLAAYHGHSSLVRLYLDHGLNVNHMNGKKDTALLWASRWGHTDTVTVLLDCGADPEVENDKGSTALYWAVRYEHPETVAVLLQKGRANPNKTRKLGLVAPLIIASAFGNVEIVSLLLHHSDISSVNLRIRGGETPIHHAAKEGCLEVVQLLIKKGAIIDVQDEIGDTPLLHAARNGHVDIVYELIKKGANVTHRNHEGHDAWDYAIEQDDNDLLALLVSNRGTADTASSRQPLCLAASNGRCDKINFLLELGMDAMSSSVDGSTCLHHAAMTDQYEVIDMFNSKISVNTQNKQGNTALHIACLNGFSKTIASLLKCKAKADIKNEKGDTALHVAAYSKHMTAETAKTLVQYAMKTHDWESLNAKNNLGNNCLHTAGKFAKPDVLWVFRFVRFKDRDQDGLTPLHDAVRTDEPEVLETMLRIFETMKRDARINEQTYKTNETVLHLAADKGHAQCVKRLIELGADISIKDCIGETVLHRLTRACVLDPQRIKSHLSVFDTVLENIVRWWCIKTNTSFPEEENTSDFIKRKREATLFAIQDVRNEEGLSVLEQGFKLGSPEILSRLLLMPGVTMFETGQPTTLNFDISGLTPRTNNVDIAVDLCCGKRRVMPSKCDDTKGSVGSEGRVSGLEWLISQNDKSRASEMLDIPPVQMIERYYMSMVSRIFVLLMILHIAYMSIFTYVGVDLLKTLRVNETRINSSDPSYILLYVIIPMEPALIILYVIYSIIRHFISDDLGRRSRLSRKSGIAMVLSVLWSYAFIAVCIVFAVLVFMWVGLFTTRYTYQDYVLAAAICIGWLLTISFTRGIRLIHYFYRMLISMIVRDVLRFLIVYVFIILAFGFAFHVLFQASSEVVLGYDTPADTLFLTFNMMIGMGELFDGVLEENFKLIGRTSSVAYLKLFYIVYILLSTIILLNLLIAMMNDSYSMTLQENRVTWRIESVSLGVQIESYFPASSRISNVLIEHGTLGTHQNTTLEERWYVNMPQAEFHKYKREMDKKQTDKQESALSERFEELEARTTIVETHISQTLTEIKEMFRDIPTTTSQPKKKKKKKSRDEVGIE